MGKKKGKNKTKVAKDQLSFDKDNLNKKAQDLKIQSFGDNVVFFPGNASSHDSDQPKAELVRSYGFDPNETLGVVWYNDDQKQWDFVSSYCYGALVQDGSLVCLTFEPKGPDSKAFDVELNRFYSKYCGVGK